MNSIYVVNLLLENAERFSSEFYDGSYAYDLDTGIKDLLLELNNRRPLNIPPDFNNAIQSFKLDDNEENKLTSYIRNTFKNDISSISLILNYLYPEKYLFYRVSMLENEIFAGFKFLSDIIDDFDFPFSKIGEGKSSFDNYLQLNKSLYSLANMVWPDLKDPKIIQQRIHYFLYQGLGDLFLTKNDYNQYWIMATGEEYFETLDTEPEVNWSGREEMKAGDLVYMYRQTPRKAIADLYSVSQDPWFDPFGGWTGFWVSLKKITPIKDITMVDMKHDEILKQWSFVKTSSQGVSTAPIPYFAYNRLLELIDEDIKKEYNLNPEITAIATQPNEIIEFKDEREFEDKVIDPLLKRWGFKHQRQYPCEFVIGSQHHTCQVDFLVKNDKNENIILFEDKIRIANEKELNRAVLQAKSYALQLGMGGFIVASPEGFWVYNLERNKEVLLSRIASDNIKEIEEMKSLILKLKAS
jgi:hypothetical protein